MGDLLGQLEGWLRGHGARNSDLALIRDAVAELKRLQSFLASEQRWIEEYKRQKTEARADYETLVDLLRARFPQREDGSLPDYKIEDVLRENERLRARESLWREYAKLVEIAEMNDGGLWLNDAGSERFDTLRRELGLET